MYNISMNVNNISAPIHKILKRMHLQNGIIRTSDLAELGIPRMYLKLLVDRGQIQKISRGIYGKPDTFIDEMVQIQSRYKATVFSHESALYLLSLSDRAPLYYSVTIPGDYNATSLKNDQIKVYFVKRENHFIGSTLLKTPFGNEVLSYNLERTICDILRNRNQLDIQLIHNALKQYVHHPDRDLNRLYQYAAIFKVQKMVQSNIEILL